MGTLPPPLSGYTNSDLLRAKARLTVPFLGKLVVVVLGLVGRQLHPSRQQVSHELARRLNYVSGKSLVIQNCSADPRVRTGDGYRVERNLEYSPCTRCLVLYYYDFVPLASSALPI